MKIHVKYEVAVYSDEGNLLADAAAEANVADIQGLIAIITGALETLEKTANDKTDAHKEEMLRAFAKISGM